MTTEEMEYGEFIRLHEPQFKYSGVDPAHWPWIFRKLKNEIWDLARRVDLNRVITINAETDEEGTPSAPRVFLKEGFHLRPENPEDIFLIDHAWTFELPSARTMLQSHPKLLVRMSDILDLPANAGESEEELIDDVLSGMWKVICTYSLNCEALEVEQKLPRWYVMDEIGSRVRHSETANCRIVPFYFIPEGITYSLLFPIAPVASGEELVRNYVENNSWSDSLTRQCRLLPWVDLDLPDEIGFEPRSVGPEYFGNSKLKDSMPVDAFPSAATILEKNGSLKVYAEYDVLAKHLKDPRFIIVDNELDADILWYHRHFYDFRTLSVDSPEKFVNQFPFESVITVKDLLAIISRRAVHSDRTIDPETLESLPEWLPTTYNLDHDLPNFIAYFRAREERNLDNLWICKPWNLARSLDITITDQLNCILRIPETGPKLCSKYIEDPVLFQREDIPEGPVKFDLRFIALLKSVSPLKVAVYKRFWLRFANIPFTLDGFEVYDKHFTVMNYGGQIHQMFCHRFVEMFEKQNEGVKWSNVEKKLYKVVKEVFQAATDRPAPEGIAPSGQSRAVYGLDFMLGWKTKNGKTDIQPMLLEINYSPDCKRACDYYPEFYDELFSYLFLDESKETIAEL